MDIRIITINDRSNYGNRLQNYALQTCLQEMGEVATLWAKTAWEKSLIVRARRLKRNLVEAAHVGLTRYFEKKKRFRQFDERYVRSVDFSINIEERRDSSLISKDAVLVIGSDQVWNINWLNENDLRYRLGLINNAKRAISYAASIGVDSIGGEWHGIFKEGWQSLSDISVREYRAAELVQEISGEDAEVVLDPTLLLTRSQWEKTFSGFVSNGDRYILTYFLGSPSKEQEDLICRIAKERDARIRRINDFSDLETYSAGPAEFVELIAKSEYVFTDSYHACCFSILFGVPFKVFNRSGYEGKACMNSRMETLFRIFGLTNSMSDDSSMCRYDWEDVNSRLGRARADSVQWLTDAIAGDRRGCRND